MKQIQKRNHDDGVTEVIGFTMILVMIFTAMMIWLVIVVPGQVELEEASHNTDIQLEFADFKMGVDNLWMSNNTGVIPRKYFTLSAAGVKTETSMMPDFIGGKATGTLSLERTGINITRAGKEDERLYMLRFISSNGYAEDVEMIYFAGGLFVRYGTGNLSMIVNGSVDPSKKVVIPILKPVTMNSWTNPSISGSNLAEADYRLLEPVNNESADVKVGPDSGMTVSADVRRMWSNVTGITLPDPFNGQVDLSSNEIETYLPKLEVSLR